MSLHFLGDASGVAFFLEDPRPAWDNDPAAEAAEVRRRGAEAVERRRGQARGVAV